MRAEYSRILMLVCMVLTLDGCQAPRTSPCIGLSPVAEFETIDPSFMLGLGILSGFDEPRNTASWQADDWVLLGVKVSHTEHASTSASASASRRADDVWFVRLCTLPDEPALETVTTTATPEATTLVRTRDYTVPFGIGSIKSGTEFRAPVGRILIETYDRQGRFLRSSVRTVPQMFPAASLLDLWRAPDERPAISQAQVGSLMMVLQTMAHSRALRPIRDAVASHVVRKPTLLGLLLGGLRFTVEAHPARGELVQSAWSADAPLLPRYEHQFPVSLSNQKLFECRMVIGSPAAPYNLIGGTLLFEATHPEKPANKLTVRVLAARHMADHARLASR